MIPVGLMGSDLWTEERQPAEQRLPADGIGEQKRPIGLRHLADWTSARPSRRHHLGKD